MILRTPDDVIRAVGTLDPEYEDVVHYTDAAGFSVKRRYPPETVVGQVTTRQGKPAVVCFLRMVVGSPTAPGGVSRVEISAGPYNMWSSGWIGPDPTAHPNLTPDAGNRLRQAPIPVALDFREEFVWDTGEGRFQNENGETVTGEQILDYAYAYHCRTLSRRFRVRYRIQVAIRWLVQQAIWRGQDWCLWLLEHAYEIRPKGQREGRPFHRYSFDEFERKTDKDGTQFFGFQTSKRAFFANVVVLTLACILAYYLAPRLGILRAIYANAALTTVALAFGFLMADQLVPLVLKGIVWGLSRLRKRVLSFLVRV